MDDEQARLIREALVKLMVKMRFLEDRDSKIEVFRDEMNIAKQTFLHLLRSLEDRVAKLEAEAKSHD